jgi:signal transduction histidine kinase
MRMDMQHTHVVADAGADVLASGIHDAKNRLFEAQTLLAQAEREQGVSLPGARFAITGAATRLSHTLVAYRLLRDQQPMAIAPVPVAEVIEDAVLTVRTQFERTAIALTVDARYRGEWPLDRTLAIDVLVNALQNACRHAGTKVSLVAEARGAGLCLSVNDDGLGFPHSMAGILPELRSGLGLFIAARIAGQHHRKGRCGSLSLANGGPLGGALFEFTLP